jgi:DNA polymerase-1
MTLVSLSRLPGDCVLVADAGMEREMAVVDLPAYVRAREVDAPRWVWDDTARWYPSLLAAGVRVERCHDLRLGPLVLRRAPAVDVQLLEGVQSEHWDRLGPSMPSDPALFSIDDTAEHLRADLEDARQLAAVAASTEAARLALLLAAESSGALVAVEVGRLLGHDQRPSVNDRGYGYVGMGMELRAQSGSSRRVYGRCHIAHRHSPAVK